MVRAGPGAGGPGGGGPGCGGPGGGLLLVHAHPDDESIYTGATMARYAAHGVPVTLVTCTLGELGEVIPAELGYLATGQSGQLGQYRIGELAAACAALGVTDHRFLGGPGRWRDSGMMGLPSNEDPGCFWQADVDEAAHELAGVIREVRPSVMISYDDNGFYGHPDHIQAHRVAGRAFQLAAGSCPVAKLYATALPRSVLASAIRLTGPAAGPDAGLAPPPGFTEVAAPDELPFGVPDEQVTTEIDGTAYLAAKTAAMRAHGTQIAVHEPFFALSNGVGQRILGREYYTLLAGPPGPPGPAGREADLLAGRPDAYV
jgi:N-acetyl-1-D-myo-inositol-2-amino-2-deoxy-alpha-D-glucopyranoside deacetylase